MGFTCWSELDYMTYRLLGQTQTHEFVGPGPSSQTFRNHDPDCQCASLGSISAITNQGGEQAGPSRQMRADFWP